MDKYKNHLKIVAWVISITGFLTLIAYVIGRPNVPTYIGGAVGLVISQLLAYYLFKGSPFARAFVLLNAVVGTAFLPFTLQRTESWLKIAAIVQLLPYIYAAGFMFINWPMTKEYFAQRKTWHKTVEVIFAGFTVISIIGVIVGLIYQPKFIAEKQAYKDQVKNQLVVGAQLPAGATDNCMTRYKYKISDEAERGGFCSCFVANIATYSRDIANQGMWKLLAFSSAYEEVCKENAAAYSVVK